jgi:hypothetical protein
MAIPKEQVMLVDSSGKAVDVDILVEELRREGRRILVDDDVGVVAYVGGLGIYELSPTDSGEFIATPVTQISQARFPVRVIRRQIGAKLFSVTADAVFVIREGDTLRKVRAEKLEAGMVLASGEKVFR